MIISMAVYICHLQSWKRANIASTESEAFFVNAEVSGVYALACVKLQKCEEFSANANDKSAGGRCFKYIPR